MRSMLLASAALLAALAVPASASAHGPQQSGVRIHIGTPDGVGLSRDRDRGDRRDRRRPDEVVLVGTSENWALNNNRSFDPESFNDWWHERPWRAYPAWVQRNRNCEQVFWAGGAWRCTW